MEEDCVKHEQEEEVENSDEEEQDEVVENKEEYGVEKKEEKKKENKGSYIAGEAILTEARMQPDSHIPHILKTALKNKTICQKVELR